MCSPVAAASRSRCAERSPRQPASPPLYPPNRDHGAPARPSSARSASVEAKALAGRLNFPLSLGKEPLTSTGSRPCSFRQPASVRAAFAPAARPHGADVSAGRASPPQGRCSGMSAMESRPDGGDSRKTCAAGDGFNAIIPRLTACPCGCRTRLPWLDDSECRRHDEFPVSARDVDWELAALLAGVAA